MKLLNQSFIAYSLSKFCTFFRKILYLFLFLLFFLFGLNELWMHECNLIFNFAHIMISKHKIK